MDNPGSSGEGRFTRIILVVLAVLFAVLGAFVGVMNYLWVHNAFNTREFGESKEQIFFVTEVIAFWILSAVLIGTALILGPLGRIKRYLTQEVDSVAHKRRTSIMAITLFVIAAGIFVFGTFFGFKTQIDLMAIENIEDCGVLYEAIERGFLSGTISLAVMRVEVILYWIVAAILILTAFAMRAISNLRSNSREKS